MPRLKQKLTRTSDLLTAAVCTIPSATVTQALSAAGLDAVIIDLEHGAVDYGSAHAMIAATGGTKCAPLVRIAEINDAQVKRVLDLGAEGIVFPLVKTADDAQRAVASMRYAPRGTRGFGPFIAQSHWQTSLPDYQAEVEDQLICCLLIETAEAVENIEDICAVAGVDLLVLATFDLTTSLGISGQFDHPDFLAAKARVEEVVAGSGIPLCGNAVTPEQSRALFASGYRMAAGFDILWLRAKAAELSACTAD